MSKFNRVIRTSALLPIAFGMAAFNQAIAAEELVYRINAGGAELVDNSGNAWSADFGYNETADSHVSLSGYNEAIQGTQNSELYWTQRYDTWSGDELIYSLPVDSGEYKVKLYFAETYIGVYGKNVRRFHINAEGLRFFTNLDVYKEVGGENIELIKTINSVTVSDGELNIHFEHSKNNPMLAGIEVFKLSVDETQTDTSTDTDTSVDTPAVIARTNVGGNAFIDSNGNIWSADSGYNTGEVSTSGNGKDIAGTQNDTLFYTQRFSRSGDLTYRYSVNNGSYRVRIHLAETYSGNFYENARVFTISAEDQLLESNVDIFKETGSDSALLKTFDNIVVSDGELNLAFSHVLDNPMIAGIEVIQLSEDTSSTDTATDTSTDTTTDTATDTATDTTTDTTSDPTAEADSVSITQQPSNQIVTEGVQVQMSVAAEGNNTLSYQWYYNDSIISGATSATLSMDVVEVSDSGNYYCVVTSGSATMTSSTASLTVSAAVKSYAAQINWTAPSTREDGSAIDSSEIESYELYHSANVDGEMELIQTVTGLNLEIQDLSSGTHYFAVRAIDNNGVASVLSQKVSITF